HAGDAERLSMRALFPRLLDAERNSGSVLRSLRTTRRTPSPGGAFVSLPGGVAELTGALAAKLPASILRLSHRVTDLRRAGVFTLESQGTIVHARAVILSVPAYVAGALLRG